MGVHDLRILAIEEQGNEKTSVKKGWKSGYGAAYSFMSA